ncbi:MAG: orotate phosphoribosyltransferase [Ignavibacteria bacterium]|nr:orotate phosphoribosyltransferase [Ignavibacteria bacterium]
MTKTQSDLLELFRSTNALLEGHFQLTSGLHSPHYFQCAKVLQYPEHLTLLAGMIAERFVHESIDVVVSPALGGIVVGTEVGRQLGKRTIFGERKDGVMSLRRGFDLTKNERALVVEDVVTTGGSVFEVLALVKQAGAVPAGVGFIVDRSNGKVKFETTQYAVLALDVVTYQPDMCPLCKSRTPITKPGSRGDF